MVYIILFVFAKSTWGFGQKIITCCQRGDWNFGKFWFWTNLAFLVWHYKCGVLSFSLVLVFLASTFQMRTKFWNCILCILALRRFLSQILLWPYQHDFYLLTFDNWIVFLFIVSFYFGMTLSIWEYSKWIFFMHHIHMIISPLFNRRMSSAYMYA